jgi:ESCO1/2 acetyl-transferase
MSAQMNMQVRQISNMLNEQLDLQDPDWLLSVDSKVNHFLHLQLIWCTCCQGPTLTTCPAVQIYLCTSSSRPDTEQVVGVAIAQRIRRAWRGVAGPQQPLTPAALGDAGATSAKASQQSSLLRFRSGAAPAGFAADSEDAGGQAAQPGCCTTAQRDFAPGDAASPSGTPMPSAQDEPTGAAAAALATPCRLLFDGSQQHTAGSSSARRHKLNTLARCWGSSQMTVVAPGGRNTAQPALSGSEPASLQLDLRLAAAADSEVTSPRTLRQPLSPLLSTPVAAGAGLHSAAGAADLRSAARGPEAAGGSAAAPAGTDETLASAPPAQPLAPSRMAGGGAASAMPLRDQHQLGLPSQQHVQWERADCGVRALWVAVGSRRRGIARALLDAAR